MRAGVVANFGHIAMVRAYAKAEITAVQPVEFISLLWSSLAGWVVFGESVDIWVWLGGMVIFSAATYIARREAMQGR
ncbi:MAG: hypothetical protein OSB58_21070 [Alphaproteobacteria bacterium]|jgi:drug/metabolite transporter (DMT)-like permease|nr:hypothetical protein [Alphaproteobacteria bacterium]